jgi:diaminohydroxyphosphoribosylaminopyrimidine deaminase/5-amino-6-(5-phosphoribosylamino)uracil reductase
VRLAYAHRSGREERVVQDERLMRRAIELAERGWGRVSPNPLVGAVVARDDEVLGEGWHEGPGTAHAEVMAMAAAGPGTRGATVYTSLEPCYHF